jgi:hypothetical protein
LDWRCRILCLHAKGSTVTINPMKKIAIVQSNYIPWRGYFDMIAAVDEFILFDDMQYTRRDWRNRNQIKTQQGLQWLTVPVLVKGKFHQKIREAEIEGTDWASKHWRALVHTYSGAPYFGEVAAWLEPLYLREKFTHISRVNRLFIEGICAFLGIKTAITNSWDYDLLDHKTKRLSHLCKQAGASEYVSGPSAKAYIDEQIFVDEGIKLSWFNSAQYPEYPQMWGPFRHTVSILDLLFNCGAEAPRFMRHVS